MDQNDLKAAETEPVELAEIPEPIFTDAEIHNIRYIKVSNGDDIIGSIVASNENLMVVKHAAKIIRFQQQDGNVTLMMMKWMTFSDDEVSLITASNVISYAKVEEKMVSFYMKGVERYLHAEEESSEPEWPEWMDNPKLDKLQIN